MRFYLLLGLALCVVFFIALGGRSFIEQVRREDYREQLAALPMSLMTQRLADVPMERREALLGEFSEQLGMQLALRSLSDASLGYFERARIERGTVLVSEPPWQLRQRLPTTGSGEQWLLEATFGAWSERQWQGSMVLLGDWLAGMPAEERLTALTRLRPGNWPLSLLNALPDDLTTEQQFQLTLGGVITRLVSDKLSITLLYQLPNETGGAEQWLQAGPISRGGHPAAEPASAAACRTDGGPQPDHLSDHAQYRVADGTFGIGRNADRQRSFGDAGQSGERRLSGTLGGWPSMVWRTRCRACCAVSRR